MDSPEFWRWIWLAATLVFSVGEMATAGTFFLLPFALGAGIATGLAFAGVDLGFEWLAFVVVSGGVFAGLRPLARRLDRDEPTQGIGAKRLIGEPGVVLEDVPAAGQPGRELGMVRVHREEWRAESVDGDPIPAGSAVRVVEVRGTRVLVHPVGGTSPTMAPFPAPDPPPDH